MTLMFPTLIVSLFIGASVVCFVYGEVAKGWFYLLSALINLNIIWLKG